jgi:hydrogenase maturation protease
MNGSVGSKQPVIQFNHPCYLVPRLGLIVLMTTTNNDSKRTHKSTCIVGMGNSLRSDDGVAAYLCQQLETQYGYKVTIIITQQLDMGLAEELSTFDTVIFIDASLQEESFSFKELSLENNSSSSSSHQINAAMLAALTRQLLATHTQFYICAIGAYDFEMGNNLSQKTMQNAHGAMEFISAWIRAQD